MPTGEVKIYDIRERDVNTKNGKETRTAVSYEKNGQKFKFFAKNESVRADLREIAKSKMPVTAVFEWGQGAAKGTATIRLP